jgi:hypothetical protein
MGLLTGGLIEHGGPAGLLIGGLTGLLIGGPNGQPPRRPTGLLSGELTGLLMGWHRDGDANADSIVPVTASAPTPEQSTAADSEAATTEALALIILPLPARTPLQSAVLRGEYQSRAGGSTDFPYLIPTPAAE